APDLFSGGVVVMDDPAGSQDGVASEVDAPLLLKNFVDPALVNRTIFGLLHLSGFCSVLLARTGKNGGNVLPSDANHPVEIAEDQITRLNDHAANRNGKTDFARTVTIGAAMGNAERIDRQIAFKVGF